MSIDRWMDKEDVVYIIFIYIYIYSGILFSHKKEWNNAICHNMDGPRDYHTKWSKSDRKKQTSYDITYTDIERQILYDIAYMLNLKKKIQMNLFTKQK